MASASLSPENILAGLRDIGNDDLADELEVLQSIFGDGSLRIWHPPEANKQRPEATMTQALRLEVSLDLPDVDKPVTISILVSLDATSYPSSSPPQLQLLSRYIGPYGVDAPLFGSILRTYMSHEGVEFSPGTVCLFDGLQSVLERCSKWYADRLNNDAVGEMLRDEERISKQSIQTSQSVTPQEKELEEVPSSRSDDHQQQSLSLNIPESVIIHEAQPIIDRKSSFVGRACTLTHPNEVPLILGYLRTDRRVARAAHPVIHAWRCRVNGLQHQDNDDDGETAAGGRLAHLLQILDVNNVLVIVTRHFGGIKLGPDRFKHINQAARNALDAGGFLDGPTLSGRGNGSHQ